MPEKKETYTLEEIEPSLYSNNAEVPKILVGGFLPKGLHEIIDFSHYYYLNNKQKYKKDYYKDYIHKKINNEERKKERVFYYFTNTALYSPVSYFPQAVSIFILNKIGDFSGLVIFFMGRLGGFLFWLTLVYFSIKITPIFKWVLLMIALFPMTIYEGMSNCADSVSIACSFLFFSLIIDSIKNGVTNKKLISIFLLSICLSLGKYIYFGLIPVFLLVILSNKTEWKKLSLFLDLPPFLVTTQKGQKGV